MRDDPTARPADPSPTRTSAPDQPSARAATRAEGDPNPGAPDLDGKPYGRYRLLQEIGRGGMGVVWRAWDTELKRVVALKQILNEGVFAGEREIERFVREARMAARLRHPGIIAVYDVGVLDGAHFMTSEFIAGETLQVRQRRPIPLRQAVEWVRKAAEALAHAHREGVVHRDVKPGNILIDPAGEPHVMDFGIAKEVRESFEPDAPGGLRTQTGALLGTPQYMSPEQARGEHRFVGPASDQFSLGVILYELLAGRPPFAGGTLVELLHAIVELDPPPPSAGHPGVPRELDIIVLKALGKEISSRYLSMGEFAADLRAWLDGEPIAARPPSAWERATRWTSRRLKVLVPTAAAAALGLALVGTLVTDFRHRSGAAGAEHARATAEAAAEAAKENLRKAGLAQNVLARWLALSGTLEKLEAGLYDMTVPYEEKWRRAEPLWAEFDEFMRETPSDPASQAVMRALAGWTRRLAGKGEEGIAWMRESTRIDPDLPYGALLGALWSLSAWIESQPLPDYVASSGGVRLGTLPPEDATLARMRTMAEGFLAQAAQAPVWGEGIVQDWRRSIAALQSLADGRAEDAERELTAALGAAGMRLFRNDLRFARARVRYLLQRFPEALADLDTLRVARAHWPPLHRLAGLAHFAGATAAMARGEDPRAEYAQAVAALEECVRCGPQDLAARHALGTARLGLASAQTSAPEEARVTFTAALADFTAALALAPDDAPSFLNRGVAHLRLGEAVHVRAQDPRAEYALASADFAAAVRLRPGLAEAHSNAAVAWGRVGEYEMRHGLDAGASLDRAIAEFDAAVHCDDGFAPAWHNRGAARLSMAKFLAARRTDPKETLALALQDFDGALRRDPEYVLAYYSRGQARALAGDAAGTLADCAEVLRRRTDFWQARVLRGNVYETQGRLAEAEAEYAAAPGQKPAQDALARVRAKQEQAGKEK